MTTDTMVQIEMTREEALVLKETLDSFLSDLRMEIADTDRMDFREHLKHRKAVLMKVLESLT